MAEKGRRPGHPETRAEIVEAAREAFVADGYDRTSLRGIAARAGVDPALIHHYFVGGKAELFAESMHMRIDPRRSVEEVAEQVGTDAGGVAAPPGKGETVVRAFLRLWDAEPPAAADLMAAADAAPVAGTPSFVSLVQAVSASPAAADALREFLIDRVWSQTGADQDPAERELRRALFTSQLNGMAFTRYVLRLEPLASATPDQIAAWIGPTLDGYASGPLPGS
jgi:AcrR family transcriptional regulator